MTEGKVEGGQMFSWREHCVEKTLVVEADVDGARVALIQEQDVLPEDKYPSSTMDSFDLPLEAIAWLIPQLGGTPTADVRELVEALRVIEASGSSWLAYEARDALAAFTAKYSSYGEGE